MISKQNTKYYIFIAFISILLYKIIDNPKEFISGIGELANFLSPFLIGILFTLLLNPIVMLFERKFKSPRLLNIFVSYIIIFILLFLGFKLFIPAIVETLNNLIPKVPSYIDMLGQFLNRNMSQTKLFETISPHIQQSLDNILNQAVKVLGTISTDFLAYVFSITSLLFNIIIGMILSVYILFDKEKIGLGCKKILYASIPKNKAIDTINFFKMSHDIFYSYIIGSIIDAFIVGIISFIVFGFIIKIDNFLFLSFIIFLTNMIPYFGPFIGATPPILMTLTYDPTKAIWVGIFILILQQIDGNFICPRIMGNQVGLSPLWIISSVLIGGSLFGIIGVFLSVPMCAVFKNSMDQYIEKRIHTKDSI